MSQHPFDLDREERSIESKRALLAYLHSPPKNFTIENCVCLSDMLFRAGWRLENSFWHKDNHHLGLMEAGIIMLEGQIAAAKEGVLRRTVAKYREFPGKK